MNRISSTALLLGGLATACATGAVDRRSDPGPEPGGSQAHSALKQPKLELQEFALENGLKVIIVEQHHAPAFTIGITYNVGSRDEVKGRTGFAHLFEHMMFQGSENIGKAEHFVLVSNYGGTMNGTTSFDRTNYFEMLPANQLELGLFLEADRMRSLDISQENLDNQRNAVQEERRMRYDNRPYGTVMEELFRQTYDNFAYQHTTIGSMEDLNAATLEDFTHFFKTYYAPNNATLVIVGDVQPKKTMALVRKYYGDIPAQPRPDIPDLTETLNKGERRGERADRLAPLPRVDMMFPTVRGNHPDYYALDLLSTILGGGESSRIYQALVKESGLATQAGMFSWQLRGSGPMWVYAMAAPGRDVAEVEAALAKEIETLQHELVSEKELHRAKTATRAQLVQTLGNPWRTVISLGQYAAYYDDPGLINRIGELYTDITAEDLQRVAKTYLTRDNRSVLITQPTPKDAAGNSADQ